MDIKEIYEDVYRAGKVIGKQIRILKGNIETEVFKLQQATNKYDFTHNFLMVCLNYKVSIDNSFMLEALTEDNNYRDIRNVLCIGIMNKEKEYLELQEVAEKWGLNDSTLRKAISNGKLVEGDDCYKEGKKWVLKTESVIREYGEIK